MCSDTVEKQSTIIEHADFETAIYHTGKLILITNSANVDVQQNFAMYYNSIKLWVR